MLKSSGEDSGDERYSENQANIFTALCDFSTHSVASETWTTRSSSLTSSSLREKEKKNGYINVKNRIIRTEW